MNTQQQSNHRSHIAPQRLRLAASLVALGVLSACGGQTSSSLDSDMGSASPIDSPPATDLAGKVFSLQQSNEAVSDLAHAGNTLAIREPGQLLIGQLQELEQGTATVVKIDSSCKDLTTSSDGTTFVLSCPKEVLLIPAENPTQQRHQETEQPSSAAVLTSDNVILAAVDGENKVRIYRDGKAEKTLNVEYPTDEMISVANPDTEEGPAPDAVVRINRKYTLIQDLDWEHKRPGAILRVGRGVSSIAPAEQGLLLASDAKGSQLALYFADDVIRLQKTISVPADPWAVAWDTNHQWAWINSQSENLVTAFDPSSGDLLEVTSYPTLANVRHMVVLDSGELVLVSASSNQVQVIDIT